MMKTLTICAFTIFLSSLTAQSDMIEAYYTHQHGYCTTLVVDKGMTLYALSKTYGVEINTIREINNKTSNNLALEEKIKVPIGQNIIVSTLHATFRPTPILYIVQRGDNLFQIAKRAGLKTKDLLRINQLATSRLSTDQVLTLGWLDIDGDSTGIKEAVVASHISNEVPSLDKPNAPIVIYSYPQSDPLAMIDQLPMEVTPQQNILRRYKVTEMLNSPGIKVTERGIAYWQKGQYSDELIVMHSNAKVNSKISIYNPMLRKSVQAKVVSEVPKGAFPNDVSVVISPSVANALGALDSRFLVEITYVE